ncbi:endo-1,4-beta-xylanase [Chlorogloeopsis sp. ULAP02]|uniref:endo-1,4-beta-xylanase n=1 Tax=Chlorogloeopsis sp. ULAP02 TaxID=3107926 RepID=UPI003135230C
MFNHQSIARRHAIKLGLAGLLGMTTVTTTEAINRGRQTPLRSHPKRDFTVVGQASLKQRAAAKGLIFGAATEQRILLTNTQFANTFVKDCGMLVAENDLKWFTIRSNPHIFDFTKGDWLAKFARTHGMLFRGTPLVWELGLPRWFKKKVNHKNAERFLVEHITKVAKHYAGIVHSWDVVNEAIAVSRSKRSDGLSRSPWLEFLGEGYIELAFRTAAKADPKAMLVYNDRWLDYDTPVGNAQRAAVLKLLERLKSKKIPVHALGIQAHLKARETRFNAEKMRGFLKDVASLGLKILITELDVQDEGLPADSMVRDRIIAAAYEDYLSVVLDEKAVIAVLTWGLSDRYTWLSRTSKRPLLYDSYFQRKLAWNAIARAFEQAPKR